MTIESTSPLDTKLIKERWNSLKLYNGYRILIAIMLLMSHNPLKNGVFTQEFFSMTALAYLGFSLTSALFTWREKPKLTIALPLQMMADVIFILLLMHAENTSHTGIGLLLVIAIAAASLISDGRLALFYAAIASIGILLGQFFRSAFNPESSDNYTTAAMLSISCFAIAWLAHSLAKRMQQSEQLASQRGLDLQNLAQVNALIAHKMADGVLVVDHDLVIKHHNIQAEAFLNLESNQGLEKHLDEISPEIAKLLIAWSSEDNSASEETGPNITKVNIASRELRVSFLPISENDNQGAVVFIEDWSQMQTQSHQVKLAALGRLTANIAHEIRNPLSAIGHANQLMQEEEDISPSNQRMLQIISDNVLRLDQIIKNVLELNRRDRTNQEVIHLENFITDFYNQFCAVENISSHSFSLSIDNTDTSILFDRRHLNQILWNLCKNGWRHSAQGENSLQLDIYLTNKSHVVNLEVTNDGENIPENVSSHLFEPFFTTEETGTGLGLYIGRELAEANGANLQFKPSKDGTKFIMLIKRATI
ncbi:MAG: two-component system sensor histidine kinase NtrB [Methylophilaceae bacterium]